MFNNQQPNIVKNQWSEAFKALHIKLGREPTTEEVRIYLADRQDFLYETMRAFSQMTKIDNRIGVIE